MNKKAQMEIVGLVVVVILVTLVMLFVVNIVSKDKPSETPEEFSHSQLASSMLSTLLKTTVDVNDCDYTIEKLIKMGVRNRQVECGGTFLGQTIEEILTEVIDGYFDQTLDTWNVPYSFVVSAQQGVWFTLEYSDEPNYCTPTGEFKKMESEKFYIPTGAGKAEVKLNICV